MKHFTLLFASNSFICDALESKRVPSIRCVCMYLVNEIRRKNEPRQWQRHGSNNKTNKQTTTATAAAARINSQNGFLWSKWNHLFSVLLHIVLNSSLFSAERALFHCCFCWIVVIHVFYLPHHLTLARCIIFVPWFFSSLVLTLHLWLLSREISTNNRWWYVSEKNFSNYPVQWCAKWILVYSHANFTLLHLWQRLQNEILYANFFPFDEKCADVAVVRSFVYALRSQIWCLRQCSNCKQ